MSSYRPQPHRPPAATIVAALLLVASPALAAVSSTGGIDSTHLRLSAPTPVTAGFDGPADLVAGMDSAQPRVLASADFDEDGMPDLVTGYRSGTSGLGVVALWRGNVDAVYPNAEEAKARKTAGTFVGDPFVGPARLTAAPEQVDFLSAGDFDADGQFDLLTGARGGSAIHFFAGDGRGRFEHVRSIELDGALTAWTSGEVNRRDGLADLAVAIDGPNGFEALVFEHPRGVLNAKPERFALPARAADVLLGNLDFDYHSDLAVAAGNRVVFIGGRDRKLLRPADDRAAVPPAAVFGLERPEPVLALAHGDFSPATVGPELALLDASGRVSYLALDLAGSSAGGSGNGEARATGAAFSWSERFTVDLTRSYREAVVLPAGALSGAAGPPSLLAATATSLGVQSLLVVAPGAAGPQLVTTPAASKGSPSGPPGTDRRALAIESAVAVLPMRLNSDGMDDLVVLSAREPSPSVAASMTGSTFTVDDDGDIPDSNVTDGVCNDGFGNCSLRAAIQQANSTTGADAIHFDITVPFGSPIISVGSQPLPAVTEAVTIDGTTDPSGGVILEGNAVSLFTSGEGLILEAATTVKGLTIADFPGPGVSIASTGSGSIIEGCVVGAASPASAFGGNDFGIESRAANVTIGGTTSAARNVIADNEREEILMTDICIGGCNTETLGNYIGIDAAGAQRLAGPLDKAVVTFDNTAVHDLGGAAAGSENAIAGTIQANGSSQDIQISGNLIGLTADGMAALPGQMHEVAVSLTGPDSLLGGATAAQRNTIAAFNSRTLQVAGSSNTVRGNSIGFDDLANAAGSPGPEGIRILQANGPLILDNVIANHVTGVRVAVDDLATTGGRIEGNCLGTKPDCLVPQPGMTFGIKIDETGSDTHPTTELVVGAPGAENMIANTEIGVRVVTNDANVAIRFNDIRNSGLLGISLNGPLRPTTNDPLDSDVGNNSVQNYPELTSSALVGPNTRVSGMLSSSPSETFTVDHYRSGSCNPSGFGEGWHHLGSANLTTDPTGEAVFSHYLTGQVPSVTPWITSTATNADGQTSEFSVCRKVSDYAPSGCTFPEDIVLSYSHVNATMTYEACDSITALEFVEDSSLALTAPLVVFANGLQVQGSTEITAGH